MQWVIDIAEIAGNPGASKVIQVSRPLVGLKGVLARVEEDEPIDVDLLAESVVEGIEVSGRVQYTLQLECSRCLKDFEEEVELPVQETFYSEPVEEEAYEIDGETFDLEPMLRDVIVLAFPMSPVHDPGCKGLCPVCGADLNEDEGHTHESTDIRWAPLEGYFEKLGESKEND